MKSLSGILAFVAILLIPQIVRAQGTTYLSNLGQTSDGNNAVGSNSWLAAAFYTGNNSSGYTLNSIQLGMTNASGNPSGFTVMVCPDVGIAGPRPGSSLGTLNGSLNPAIGGIFTYTPASNLTLSPNTDYFIVLTAGTVVANGAYEWSFMTTSSYNPSGGWGGAVTFSSNNGLSPWIRLGTNPYDYSQFAINVTPIPEPGVLDLFGLGGLAFLWHRRKSKAVL